MAYDLSNRDRIHSVFLTVSVCLGNDGTGMANKPRPQSENSSSYVSSGFAEWLRDKGTKYAPCAAYHPQAQGKIEVDSKPW